jgi:hypothetical protein
MKINFKYKEHSPLVPKHVTDGLLMCVGEMIYGENVEEVELYYDGGSHSLVFEATSKLGHVTTISESCGAWNPREEIMQRLIKKFFNAVVDKRHGKTTHDFVGRVRKHDDPMDVDDEP